MNDPRAIPRLLLVVCLLHMSACSGRPVSTYDLPVENLYYDALTAPGRSDDDKERDPNRRPEQILALAGIEPGMSVAELMSGGGWYAEVLARSVGSSGRVVAHNSELTHERYGSALEERLENVKLKNLERLVQNIDALALPHGSMDAVFLVQFYHDLYWMKIDRVATNKAIFDALKPGGVYLVIDHAAEVGSGDRDTESLHRVDEDLVAREILAAGFKLSAKTDVLRNKEDARDTNVFRWPVRGKTDRFVLKFEKPLAE